MKRIVLTTLCYVKNEGKTLMLHRIKKEKDVHEGKWNGLGGKFEPGETPEECVIREVAEESGLLIENPKMHGFLVFPDFKPDENWHMFVYTADQFSGDLIADCPEGKLEWVEDSKILDLNLWEGDPIFMKWIEEGKFFSGKFCYENKKLTSHSATFH